MRKIRLKQVSIIVTFVVIVLAVFLAAVRAL
jgi:hypothetical protein